MTSRRRDLVIVLSVVTVSLLAGSLLLYVVAGGEPYGSAYVSRDAAGELQVGLSPCGDERIDRVTVTAGDRPVWDVARRAGAAGLLSVPLGTVPAGYSATAAFRPPAGDDVLSFEVTGTSGVRSGVALRVGELPPGTYQGEETDGPAPTDRLDGRFPRDFGC